MTPHSLRDLYHHQLRDMHSAQNQLVDALPDFVERAYSDNLRSLLREYLGKVERQRDDIGRIFENIGEDVSGETCHAMKGLIRETRHFFNEVENIFKDDAPPSVQDAGLIADMQRILHYEIAGFGTVAHYAEVLGRTQDLEYLRPAVAEAKALDERLNRMAKETINIEAAATVR